MEILARRFGKKIKLPPTIQIKHQILLRWLEDQTEKEAAEVRKDRFEKTAGRRHAQRWRKGRPVIAGSELHLIGFLSKFLRTTTRCARYLLVLAAA